MATFKQMAVRYLGFKKCGFCSCGKGGEFEIWFEECKRSNQFCFKHMVEKFYDFGIRYSKEVPNDKRPS